MEEKFDKRRAWIEVNLDNLCHNIYEIRKVISDKTKIMAVVKADGYGHGAVRISKSLMRCGVSSFAVATLDEAIELRKNGILGEILILGYVSGSDVKLLEEYDLICSIVSHEHALELLNFVSLKKLKVHLKINTGMNRVGLNALDYDFIKDLYLNEKLDICGIYSHLSCCDSEADADIEFSYGQIKKFDSLIERLTNDSIKVVGTHLQSSYGILNYSECKYDYVRPGIIMYGVDSLASSYKKVKLDLKPVLKLKSRITSIRKIRVGEDIGYGRTFKSKDDMVIGTVSIGYADGYPRSLSGSFAKVKVVDSYCEIVGRICMDQLMINLTGVTAKVFDEVELIGEDKEIRACNVALKASSITNELLSRLGSRLSRVYIDTAN